MSNSVVDITQKLISFPSVTPKDEGAQDYLKSFLKPLGFEVYDLPFEGRGSYRVENFFARRGTAGPHICFAGHTDVVPAGDEAAWSVPPFAGTIKGDVLIGRGASDMKGQVAAFVAAVQSFLKDNPAFDKGSVSLLITGDEEADAINGTARVLEWMKANNHIPDACIVGEPSNPDYMGQEIKIGRRGSLGGKLTVKGTQGHVAYPERTDNPLPRLVKYLDVLASTVFDRGSAYFPPSNLEITTIDVGNKAGNVVPANGSAAFNIRFSDRWTMDTLEEKIRSLLDSVGTGYEIVFTHGAHPFLTQPGVWTNLVAAAVEKVTGHKPAMTTNGGTSDARFVASYCPVVEFGMVNKTIHQVDEFCTLPQLEKCEAVYKEILKQYFA